MSKAAKRKVRERRESALADREEQKQVTSWKAMVAKARALVEELWNETRAPGQAVP
jgi:hypothetical protein